MKAAGLLDPRSAARLRGSPDPRSALGFRRRPAGRRRRAEFHRDFLGEDERGAFMAALSAEQSRRTDYIPAQKHEGGRSAAAVRAAQP